MPFVHEIPPLVGCDADTAEAHSRLFYDDQKHFFVASRFFPPLSCTNRPLVGTAPEFWHFPGIVRNPV
jgi:hypothetical protein